jgi:hypothetical protein
MGSNRRSSKAWCGEGVTPGLNYGQIWCHKVSNIRGINNIAIAGDGEKINEKFNDTQNIERRACRHC